MAELRIKIVLDGDQFDFQTDKSGKEVKRLEGIVDTSFESIAGNIAVASLAFNEIRSAVSAVADSVAVPIEKFREFQSDMSNVATLGVQNMDQLTAGVLGAASEIPVPLGNISAGLYDVVSAGVDAANQIEVLETTARAAKAGIAETSESLNLASAFIKGYGESWSATESILDQAFKTVELGQTNFGQLASSVGGVIPLASALKEESYNLLGAFATLTGVTGNTSEVSTQLKAVFSELARPTADLTKLVREKRQATVEDFIATEGLVGLSKLLQEETGGSATAMNKLFGSTEAVTALLALAGSQYDTLIEKTEEIKNSTGAMANAYDIATDTIDAQLQLLENRFEVRMIAAVDAIEPLISGILDLGIALLDVDYEPFIIGTITAGAAIAGLGIASTITAMGGFAPALATAGIAFSTFSATVSTAITAIPVAGWIAGGISALGALSVVLYATAEDERELAEQRMATTTETINLIQAEKDRVEQAITTGGATEELTTQVGQLNKQLIAQQKILSDSKIGIYTDELEAAKEEFRNMAELFADASGISFGVEDGVDATVDKLREMTTAFGDDFIGMRDFLLKEMADLSDQINGVRATDIRLTSEKAQELKAQQAELQKIYDITDQAAAAQKQLNDELGNRERLNNIKVKVTVDPDPDPNPPVLKIDPVTVDLKPQIDPEFNIDFGDTPQDLDFFDTEQFSQDLFDQEEMLRLHYENRLITEDEYNLARKDIQLAALAEVEANLGTESRLYLKMNADRIKEEKRSNQQINLIRAQATSQALGSLQQLLIATGNQSRQMFAIIKGASIAQAIVDTYAAANRALATLPPPASFVVAAATIAAGTANVIRISQQQFEAKAEGGMIDAAGRTVAEGDFGGGENRFIIANNQEFIVRAGQAQKNQALLEHLNASNEQFHLVDNIVFAQSALNNISQGDRRAGGGFVDPTIEGTAGFEIITVGQEIIAQVNQILNIQNNQLRDIITRAEQPPATVETPGNQLTREDLKEAFIEALEESNLFITGEFELDGDVLNGVIRNAEARRLENSI